MGKRVTHSGWMICGAHAQLQLRQHRAHQTGARNKQPCKRVTACKRAPTAVQHLTHTKANMQGTCKGSAGPMALGC